jgi:hypothetical protein
VERKLTESHSFSNYNPVAKDDEKVYIGVSKISAPLDKLKVNCYQCDKMDDYTNNCKVTVTASKSQQKACNYVLQVNNDNVKADKIPASQHASEKDQASNGDDIFESLNRDQYDPENTYVLEKMKDIPLETEDEASERACG